MSYIRPTSNPERLYVYSPGHQVEFIQGANILGVMDRIDFDNLARRFVRKEEDEEPEYIERTELYTEGKAFLVELTNGKWRIGVAPKWSIDLYEVTLQYMFREEELIYRLSMLMEKTK